MIRFYKTIAKIVRTLKSYLTGAVLKIRYFSYNVIALCYSGKEKAKRGVKIDVNGILDTPTLILKPKGHQD